MLDFFIALIKYFLIASGIISVTTFVMYAQERMHENEKKELLYKKIHFTTLTLFCIAGVVLLILLLPE